MIVCSVDGCAREDIRARGMCGPHYQRWWASGDPGGAITGQGSRALSEEAKQRWMRKSIVGIHGTNPITGEACGEPLRPVVYFGHPGAYCDACKIGGHPTHKRAYKALQGETGTDDHGDARNG